MEFSAGLLVLLAGLGGGVAALRSRRWRTGLFVATVAIEVGILWSLRLDWGYSWVQESPWHMGLEQNVWILTPGALALLVLVGVARWGSAFAPYGAALALLQGLGFIPMLLQVERNTSMSFLAAAPIADLFAVLLAAFWMLPAACATLPEPGSYWYRVAFGPRASLMEALSSLKEWGFEVNGPRTVLESGEARGRLGNLWIEVTTPPFFWSPPGYGLRIVVRGIGAEVQPPRPRIAPVERMARQDGALIYEGISPKEFQDPASKLRGFLRSCLGDLPTALT